MAIRIYSIFLGLLVATVYGSNTSVPECLPDIVHTSLEKEEIELHAVHSQSSITNGSPYGPVTKSSRTFILNQNTSTGTAVFTASRSNQQTVNVAYNGSHVCVSAQFLYDYEYCSLLGCQTNKTTTCVSKCFHATDLYNRYTVSIFQSYTKSSGSLGEWQMSDYVDFYTVERLTKELKCYYLKESYSVFNDEYFVEPTPNVTTCPVGQRCRITIGKYTVSSFPMVYLGCEITPGHYDGCKEGCSGRQVSPNNVVINWASMCRYCCSKDFCNDRKKCVGLNCDLKKELSSDVANLASDSFVSCIIIIFFSAVSSTFLNVILFF